MTLVVDGKRDLGEKKDNRIIRIDGVCGRGSGRKESFGDLLFLLLFHFPYSKLPKE